MGKPVELHRAIRLTRFVVLEQWHKLWVVLVSVVQRLGLHNTDVLA